MQEGILHIIFKIADDQKLLLLDLKDLKSMVQYIGDNASDFKNTYGNITTASIGAIQRSLIKLEEEGGNSLFGEPGLDVKDWFKTDGSGRGYINVLNCEKLFLQPDLYSAFMLWMLSDLYEILPEAGDMDKPKIVFFFDEAHLLFKDAPKELLEKIEQVVRLIRSKGVGIFFITQNPIDIPIRYYLSSETEYSTLSEPILQASRKRLKLLRKRLDQIRSLILNRPLPSAEPARL